MVFGRPAAARVAQEWMESDRRPCGWIKPTQDDSGRFHCGWFVHVLVATTSSRRTIYNEFTA